MKNVIRLSVAGLLLVSCSGNIDVISEEVKKLSGQFVPDKRIDIAEIEARKGGGDTIILKGETTLPELKNTIIKTLSDRDILLIDSIYILPDTTVNDDNMGLATLSVINLRRHPSHSSELVSQAVMGTPLMVLKTQGSWLMVRTPDMYISWTERSSVRIVNKNEMEEWRRSDRVVYEKSSGWLYTNIAETGVVSDLVAGCIMARTGDAREYARIMLPDGREGLVIKADITPLARLISRVDVRGEDIEARARTLMGVPYLWGGSSSKGVDCSGFVQTVFFMNGIITPRDADQQALYGDPVDISNGYGNLSKGDLLFFGTADDISHVAIYLENGEYIHSSGRVMVNSLDSLHHNYSRNRHNSLVKAQRYLSSGDPGVVQINNHSWY